MTWSAPFAPWVVAEWLKHAKAIGGPQITKNMRWTLTHPAETRRLSELQEELTRIESKLSEQYWRFSRSNSTRVSPPDCRLHARANDIRIEMRNIRMGR